MTVKTIRAIIENTMQFNPSDPLPIARAFVAKHYSIGSVRTLHHHAGVFHHWNSTCYQPADSAAIRALVYEFLEPATRWDGKAKKIVPFQPTTTKVNDTLDGLRAVTNLPATITPPYWLDYAADCCPPAGEIIACSNGLLHLPTMAMQAPTPRFFSLNALEFAFAKDASAPTAWLGFLHDLWPDDPAAVTALQDTFGYCLTGDTRQQKAFMIVGPKRSGKGTIGRVLTALLGQANVCAPTLASLGQNFGLAPLIGKQLAIIADARLGGRTDQQAIAERLLSISGEDALTIDRKFLPPWTGRLPTRFLVLTNELPRIGDASGALASRFVILMLTKSFYGIEDHGLTDRLIGELPGILLWAIAGWRRLNERGFFVQPLSSAEAAQQLEDLGSPITAFIREDCIVKAGYDVACSALFGAWCEWCKTQGRDNPGTAQTFGRDLRAVLPGIKMVSARDGDGRTRRYEGVGLK